MTTRGIISGSLQRAAAIAIVLVPAAAFCAGAADIEEMVKIVTANAAGDAERAAKLNAAAAELADDPAVRTAFYRRAFDYGITSPAGLDEAARALDGLESTGAVDDAALQDRKLLLARKQYALTAGPTRRTAAASLVAVLATRGDTAMAAEETAAAADLYTEALRIAGAAGMTEQVAALREKVIASNARIAREKKVAALKEKLEQDPADDKTRRALIDLYLVERDDPAAAMKLFTDETDLALVTYTKMATRKAADLAPEECGELGGWYKSLATKAPSDEARGRMLARAAGYCRAAMAGGEDKGIAALKARLELKKIEDQLAQLGVSATATGGVFGREIDLLESMEPDRHAIHGAWVKKSGMLGVTAGPYNSAFLPAPAPDTYELAVAFIRKTGDWSVNMVFPVAGRSCLLRLSGGTPHRTYDLGIPRPGPGTRTAVTGDLVVNGRLHTVVVRVDAAKDPATIEVSFDGDRLLWWRGDPDAIRILPAWARRFVRPKLFGLATHETTVLFKSAKLKTAAPPDPPAVTAGGNTVAFLPWLSMLPYPKGHRNMTFPVQETDNGAGPFLGSGVYFRQKSGMSDVVYAVTAGRPVKGIYWKGAAMLKMTMEVLAPDGTVLARSGPHAGGNRWGEFTLAVPPAAGRRFRLRFSNHISTWYYINTVKLVH